MSFDLPERPRRNRKSAALRALTRETVLTPADLIYPVFVQDTPQHEAIEALPGLTRFGLSQDADVQPFIDHLQQAHGLGIQAVALFPKIDGALKSPQGQESHNPEGLVPRAIRLVKQAIPTLAIVTDVALDPYSSIGHDGIARDDIDPSSGARVIDNDKTVEALCQQALSQAQAGTDIVAPSDMMDGRVGAIRQTLDAHGYTDVSIMSYTAKYASAFYGPFRGALDSAPVDLKGIPKDKTTYQMDPANAREALREASLDIAEGADIVMVKPAGAYLDIIQSLRASCDLPVAAYQVSGEYLMLQAAARSGYLDLKAGALESLLSIKRAGSDMILTYLAPEAARWLG